MAAGQLPKFRAEQTNGSLGKPFGATINLFSMT